MADDSLIKKFGKFGFNSKEAQILAFLSEKGGDYPSSIAKSTRINRVNVYQILTALSIKGLVTETFKGKKLYYQLEPPKKFLRFAEMKKERVEKELKVMQEIIPDLEEIFDRIPNKPRVRFFEGKKGVLSVYEDHVSVKKSYEMLGFSNIGELLKFFPENFYQKYIRAKEKIGISSRAILPSNNRDIFLNTPYKYVKKKSIIPLVKTIDEKLFSFRAELTIYGDNRVSLIKFIEEEPVGVIIEDKIFHDFLKLIFELAWQRAA